MEIQLFLGSGNVMQMNILLYLISADRSLCIYLSEEEFKMYASRTL